MSCLIYICQSVFITGNKHGRSKYKGNSGETSDKLGHESDQKAPSGVDTPSLKIVTSDTDVSIFRSTDMGFGISLIFRMLRLS